VHALNGAVLWNIDLCLIKVRVVVIDDLRRNNMSNYSPEYLPMCSSLSARNPVLENTLGTCAADDIVSVRRLICTRRISRERQCASHHIA
jgi:hypothetical protein